MRTPTFFALNLALALKTLRKSA